MKTLRPLITLFSVLSLSTLAYAQDVPATQTWWQLLLTHLLELVLIVVTPSLIMIARGYAQVLAKKAGIEMAERQNMLLDDLTTKAIAYAHEKGRNALKAGQALDPADKKSVAVNYVNDGINHLGLPSAAQEMLAQLVESKLNQHRSDPVKPGEHTKK